MASWYEKTELSDYCSSDTHCERAEPNGNCDPCGTIDGRYMESVNIYASTCDVCGNLTSHDELEMNEDNQLGTCYICTDRGLKA